MNGRPDQKIAKASKNEECGATTRTGASDFVTLTPVIVTEKPQHLQQTRPKKQETYYYECSGLLQVQFCHFIQKVYIQVRAK